jgi:hypothetical protein
MSTPVERRDAVTRCPIAPSSKSAAYWHRRNDHRARAARSVAGFFVSGLQFAAPVSICRTSFPTFSIKFDTLAVWDKMLGLGTTDPLAGFASTTANLIVSFHFAKRGFENVAKIIRR